MPALLNRETMNKAHKEWYSRGYLPHFDHPGKVQMITFRLADALPSEIIMQLEQEVKRGKDHHQQKRRRVEAHLDAGLGSCCLRDPRLARLVEDALLHFDHQRYRLCAWVVMPNHVHALLETWSSYPLPEVIHSWKSFTANQANRLLRRSGQLWQAEYFDRYMRDARHFRTAFNYIHHNPVKAGLVLVAEDWPFSSARRNQ